MRKQFYIRMNAIYFLLIISIFFGCKKEQITKEVLIKYEFNDDVSPVKVTFSVEGNFSWSEWMIDNKSFNAPEYENKGTSSWLFMDIESGLGIVNFSGTDKNDIHYKGQANILLPKVATKIEFAGLSAENLSEIFPDLEGNYTIEFQLYNPDFSAKKATTIHLKDNIGESVKFEQAVQFDITKFYDNPEYCIVISIYRTNQPNPFLTKFVYLKTAYLSDRLKMNKIQFNSTDKHLFLETDWKP